MFLLKNLIWRLYMDTITIEKLLVRFVDLVDKYEEIDQQTGNNFNIFNISGTSAREKTFCLLLRELISPDGTHGQKNRFLKLFMSSFLKIENVDCKNAIVKTEYPTKNGRRIDIVIEIPGSYFIPIEVKTNDYTIDQDSQCFDYYEEMRTHKGNLNRKIFYLTLEGKLPSSVSAGKLIEMETGIVSEELVTKSFSVDVLSWLYLCLQDEMTIKLSPIREILLQFIQCIKKLTGQLEDHIMNEALSIIMKNGKNMEAAVTISNAIAEAKIALVKKIFLKLDEQIRKKKPNLLRKREYEFDFEVGVKYFNKPLNIWLGKENYPGLLYSVPNLLEPYVFGIEYYSNERVLYYGFTKNEFRPITLDEEAEFRTKYPKFSETNRDGCWVHYEYINYGNGKKDFVYNTENSDYYALFDDNGFLRFIEQVMVNINNFLGNIELKVSQKNGL